MQSCQQGMTKLCAHKQLNGMHTPLLACIKLGGWLDELGGLDPEHRRTTQHSNLHNTQDYATGQTMGTGPETRLQNKCMSA